MIVSKGELKMVKKGRRWLEFERHPEVKTPSVIRLRTSGRDRGLVVTADRLVWLPEIARYRLLVRPGDCLEHLKLMVPSGRAGSGVGAEKGYTEDRFRAMRDEPEVMT